MKFDSRMMRIPLAASLGFAAALSLAQPAPSVKAGVKPAAATQAPGAAKPLAGQVVRIAWIDPLSGLMGPVGNNQFKSLQFFAEKYSLTNPAGVKFEVFSTDNKLSPTETLNALKAVIDQDVRYVVQGNGSSVAIPLIDAINKHNERNPGKEVVYLNDAAVDPDLTNSK